LEVVSLSSVIGWKTFPKASKGNEWLKTCPKSASYVCQRIFVAFGKATLKRVTTRLDISCKGEITMAKKKQKKSILDKAVDAVTTRDEKEAAKEAQKAAEAARHKADLEAAKRQAAETKARAAEAKAREAEAKAKEAEAKIKEAEAKAREAKAEARRLEMEKSVAEAREAAKRKKEEERATAQARVYVV
jgi:ABC-type oligopeptide transport system ATPase subunit